MALNRTENAAKIITDNPAHEPVHVKGNKIKDSYHGNHRPRELRLYVNGDRYFRGKKIYLTPNRYYNFGDLLNDLTGKLPANMNLPYGVRQIFTPQRGRRIHNIEDLLDGQTYICAGFEGFKMIKYGQVEPQHWSMSISQPSPLMQQQLDRPPGHLYIGASNAFHPGRYFRSNQSHPQRRWPERHGTNQRVSFRPNFGEMDRSKIITVIKMSKKHRVNIKILLNRRSIQSYEQLIADISETFWPKSKIRKGLKLFTARGKEVLGISDFFREDDLFLAVDGGDSDLSEFDVADALGDLLPEEVVKSLVLEWKKNEKRRRKHSPVNNAIKSNKSENVSTQIEHSVSNQVQDKRDSGFDSAEVSVNRSELEHTDRSVPPVHKSDDVAKEGIVRSEPQREVDSLVEVRRSYELPSLPRIGRGRLSEGNEENEKLKLWRKNISETDRRIGIVNRRKRILVPLRNLDNQLKKVDDTTLKDANKEQMIKGDELRQEVHRKDFVSAPKEGDANLNSDIRATEALISRKETLDKFENVTSDKSMVEDDKMVENKMIDLDKRKENKLENYSDHRVSPTEINKITNQTVRHEQVKEKEVGVSIETAATHKVVPVHTANSSAVNLVSLQNDTNDNNNNIHLQKEKRKQEREEQQQRKRAKTKIVRKTKLERMVSDNEYVLSRFELGRKLGDGNFAVVCYSRKVETGQEFAVKVIDKAKLKGKDHMVENEIDILKDCCHNNIVRLYEEYETRECIYLVMELVKGGDLFECITKHVKFGEVDSARMIKDVCNALFYMHSRSIVHRDLKPENLLVHRSKDGTITLKLADFGLAMEVTGPIYTVCGTPTYVAPEILADKGYGLEVDMWAVGVITYILLCGFPPFRSPDRNQTELFKFIKAGHFEFLSPYWDNISKYAKDLISHLLVVNRRERYNAIDVLCHRWILCSGQAEELPDGFVTLDGAMKETRRELVVQTKLNYESYQKLKRRKKQELERKEK